MAAARGEPRAEFWADELKAEAVCICHGPVVCSTDTRPGAKSTLNAQGARA